MPATGSTSTRIQLPTLTTKTGFKFPAIFSFPPFFTKQPNQQTWAHQASLWQQIILAYCRHHRIFKFDFSPGSSMLLEDSELFYNASISSTAEYYPGRLPKTNVGSTKTYMLIHWEAPTGWAERMYAYVSSNGLTNTVMTLHELTSPDHQPSDMPLVGLDPIILRKALAVLVKDGKAKIFKGSVDGAPGDGDGVKFF